jgi:hypothetical protein
MTRIANAANEPEEHEEIEITEEMIGAGELAFSEHDPRFEGDSVAVERIFRAMLKIAIKQGKL